MEKKLLKSTEEGIEKIQKIDDMLSFRKTQGPPHFKWRRLTKWWTKCFCSRKIEEREHPSAQGGVRRFAIFLISTRSSRSCI